MLHYSKYNELCELPDSSSFILYNFLSGSMLLLDSDGVELFRSILNCGEHHTAEREMLAENGFLVDYDELDYMKVGHQLAASSSEQVSLLIAPTMDCNLACPYCFEKRRRGVMSEEVQGAICTFVDDLLDKVKCKQLFVYWFGGEPALELGIIKSLAARLQAVSERHLVNYVSAMSTNGTALVPEAFHVIREAKISRVQITIDGSKESHDESRPSLDGKSSYDQIMSNLMRAETDAEIQVRMNVSRRNVRYFTDLEQRIDRIAKSRGLNISTYAARLESYDYSDQSIAPDVLTVCDYSRFLMDNAIIGAQRQHFSRFLFCDAAKLHSFCFDELGNMYKCWNEVGDIAKAYANILDFDLTQNRIDLKGVVPFLASGFPEDPECLSCKVLPLCVGGCIHMRLRRGKKECSPVKYNLRDYILRKYSIEQGEQYHEAGH